MSWRRETYRAQSKRKAICNNQILLPAIQPADAVRGGDGVGDSVRVGVEWGKHGSTPLAAAGQAVRGLEQLTQHWRRLHAEGRRLPDHALSRGWPVHFTESLEDYLRLDAPLELRSRLPDIHRLVRSRWPNAALNQRLLPYNFAVKTGWPDDAPLEPAK